jgi:hypothetical protein
MFGGTDSDTDDNSDALAASALFAAGGTWALTRSKYTTSKEIQVPPGTRIVCSSGECQIDGSSITAPDAPNSAILYFGQDSQVQLPALASNIIASTLDVSFSSAHGLLAGDYFYVYNPTDSSFSGFRTAYRAGEWCKVAEVVSTTVVKVSSLLYASYAIADVDLYKPAMSTYSISGNLSVFDSGSAVATRGISFNRVVDTDISGVKSKCHDASSALLVNQCVNMSGLGLNIVQSGEGGIGTNYGISISNSQDCTFRGDFSSTRHGVSHGGASGPGAVPCRNIKVYGTA